jgi:VWFA-related protein
MRIRNLLAAVSLLNCCLAAHPNLLAAQTTGQNTDLGHAPASQADVPVIKANTRAVVVDVVVTKGLDEAVTGLHTQDFRLMEDGKPQAIDFFEEHAAPGASMAMLPMPKMPPHVFTNVPAAPKSDAVNVLLLDSLNTPRPDQSYMHAQILAFLKSMKPDARIAIFGLSSQLRMIQGFSDDPAVLRAALEDKRYGFSPVTTNVSRGRTENEEDKAEVAQKIADNMGVVNEGIRSLMALQSDFAEVEHDRRTEMTLEALQNLGRYLAAIPGRKNLIWFASQYPVDLFPKSLEKQPFNDRREHTQEIKETTDLLMVSKVSVYPIHAEGMMNDHPMEASNSLEAAGGKDVFLQNIMNGAGERADVMSAMERLASQTGGEAIFNSNDLNAALGRAIHNGEHYYTLVYTPSNKEMNGQFRHIEIKLDGAKGKLSYRSGYYADDAAPAQPGAVAEASKKAIVQETDFRVARLRSMLGRGMPSATEVLYGVRVLPANPQPGAGAKPAGFNAQLSGAGKGSVTRYGVDFLIDPKKVQLQATPEGNHAARIRVELLAYDRDGKALNWNGVTLHSNLDTQAYASILKSGIPVHMEIDVPQNGAYLATGIYDLDANKAGTLEVPLESAPAMAAAQGGSQSR